MLESYHMMLRDLEGDFVTREIKEWILNRNNIFTLNSFKISEKLSNQPYYHILENEIIIIKVNSLKLNICSIIFINYSIEFLFKIVKGNYFL